MSPMTEVEDLRSRLACVLEATYWDRPYDNRIAAIRGLCDLTTNGMRPCDPVADAETRVREDAAARLAAIVAEPDDTQWWPVVPYRDDGGNDDDELVEVQVLNADRISVIVRDLRGEVS